MVRRAALIAAVLLPAFAHAATPASSIASATSTGVTPDLLLSDYASRGSGALRPVWLADSRHLLVSVAASASPSALRRIERIDVATGRREVLVEGEHPVVAPDGKAFAFFVPTNAGYSLCMFDLATRTTRKIALLPIGLRPFSEYDWSYDLGISWTTDARRLAYSFRPVLAKPAVQKSGGPSVRVIGAAGDIPEPSQLWIADLASGSIRKLFETQGTLTNLSWTGDGAAVIANNVLTFETRDDVGRGTILSVAADSGAATTVVAGLGVQELDPSLSPDRQTIVFKADPANQVYPYFWNVATVPATGGAVRQLTHGIYVGAGQPIWTADGRILFTCKRAVFRQICAVDRAGGSVHQLTSALRSAGEIAVAPSSRVMAWVSEDPFGRTQIRTARIDGKKESVVLDSGSPSGGPALGDVEEVGWKSRDGLNIAGLLIKPLNYKPGSRYPMIVDVHGGPVGGVSLAGSLLNGSPMEWQMWAAKGYAVLVPDYRDSAIPGWEPIVAMRAAQDYNERDMDDIMSGVDGMIARGIADPGRLGLIGHSKGAFMVNWILTQTHRFRVAVSYEGWSDNNHTYGAGQRLGGNSILEWRFAGKPWEAPQNYARNAPANYLKGVATPTLLIAGDYGGASGVENLSDPEIMYSAWRRQGVPTEMLVYRGEGHVISRPENQRDLLTRAVAWIEEWIGK